MSFDQAVLSDPFSVSLHAILKAPPADGEMALVYGCGTLGILSIAILSTLYPKAKIVAVCRHPMQEKIAKDLGAYSVIRTYNPVEIIEKVAEMTGTPIYRPQFGKPWLLRGVDVIYDTIGSGETLEIGLRITRPRAAIVVTGVSRPARLRVVPALFQRNRYSRVECIWYRGFRR